MDQQGIEQFESAQAELVSRGGTNFMPVFDTCFNELLKDDSPSRARSVLFISDGAPCERDSDILRAIAEKVRMRNLSVIAAGFGTGTKADLMSAIAQCGCGPFVYIPESKDIPQQLGRIWAAVAHTSLSSAFAVVRPLSGAQITTVEGAFGAAELSLRPDGRKSSEQVLIVQLGGVRYGASREVVLQLRLPPHLLSNGMAKISNAELRKPLLEVSLVSQVVSEESPVYLQRAEFLMMQVPSLLMDSLLPFPVRMVLDNDLDEFDPQIFLRKTAATLGVAEHELELTRLLRGSVIIDMHLKVDPVQASDILDRIALPEFQQSMGKAMQQAGYKLKAMSAPGQQVFRRLLQTRFAHALGAAAKHHRKDGVCDEIQVVQVLATSEVARCLDPPGPSSMAVAVAKDCNSVQKRLSDQGDNRARDHLGHDLVQLQASHVAQYKCQSVAASLERYELPEAREAAEAMTISCGDMSIAAAFWETVCEKVELLAHDSTADQLGVMVGLRPKLGREVDFSHLAKQVSPVFEVRVAAEELEPYDACVSYAHVVDTGSLRPVIRRSCHPSSATSRIDDCVRVPFAQSLKVTIDPKSCRHGGSLAFYADAEHRSPVKVVNHNVAAPAHLKGEVGEGFWQFCFEGSELWFSFRPDLDPCAQTEWGYHFEVEGVMPTQTLPGLLLQAGLIGLSPGTCHISVKSLPHMFEIPAASVQTRELHGSATERTDVLEKLASAVNANLVLDQAASATFGFTSRVRLLRMNVEPVRSKVHLKQLASTPESSRYPGNDVVQLAFTSDTSMHGCGTEKLLKSKLQGVSTEISRKLVATLVTEVPVPRQPELVGWSWDGSSLQLSWRFGWPVGSCALEVVEVDSSTAQPAHAAGAFFMISPEVAVTMKRDLGMTTKSKSRSAREPVRVVEFTLPASCSAILKLELKHYAPPCYPPEERYRCGFNAWLVPNGNPDLLQALTTGQAGEGRRLFQGLLATLVTDSS